MGKMSSYSHHAPQGNSSTMKDDIFFIGLWAACYTGKSRPPPSLTKAAGKEMQSTRRYR
jgi:hypothetical protein